MPWKRINKSDRKKKVYSENEHKRLMKEMAGNILQKFHYLANRKMDIIATRKLYFAFSEKRKSKHKIKSI